MGANAHEKVPKGRIAGQTVPQDERVGEEANQSFDLALVAQRLEEPDGLGNIAEEKVLAGRFTMPNDERIGKREQEKLLLIAMVEDLLRYEIALREQQATGEREGQCQSCGKREASTHAHPGHHRHLAPSWIRVACTQARADQAR